MEDGLENEPDRECVGVVEADDGATLLRILGGGGMCRLLREAAAVAAAKTEGSVVRLRSIIL